MARAKSPARPSAGEPVFFASAAAFRRWLAAHHATHDALVVGFYKKELGKAGLTYGEAVDEALCFGWIDGVLHSLGDGRYTHRFTPRRKGSIWSAINIAKVERLTAEGRMAPAGLAAFAARTDERSRVYSHERAAPATLEPAEERRFRANRAAWAFFESQPPSYRRAALHLVTEAKKPETRAARLATLIADSAAGVRLKALRPRPGKR